MFARINSKILIWGKKVNMLIIAALLFSMISMQPIRTVSAQSSVSVRVSQSSDDAEEAISDGEISLDSSDLELIEDSGFHSPGEQIVGIRFLDVEIPENATIQSAYIEFEVDETSSDTASLSISGQAADNPGTFTSDNYNISTRSKTTSSVVWSPDAWDTEDEKHQTPDLSSVVQEIVDRGGWTSGNAMAFLIGGSGTRTAEAVDGEPDEAPLLVIEYEELSGPTIIVNSTMTSFHTEPGTPSVEQSYSVSGINLTGDISISAPNGFELSTDNSTYTSSIVLSQSGGEVTSTDIYVRLTGAEGSWSGDITHNSDGASENVVPVSGTCTEALPWVAYNDLAWESGQLETNITKYTITSGSDSGLLVDYATGVDVPVTATITSSGDLEINTGTYGGAETASGTDAYDLFHGIVDMPGVLHYGDLGWWVEVTFTNLNPLNSYVFATSANRDGSSYDDRISKFIIQDVDSAVNTSSAGAAISTTSITDDTTVFCTGNNTGDGYIARWSNVEPGVDGDFTVRVESNSSTDEHAYGFSVFMLGEEGPTGPGIGTSVSTLSEFISTPGAISSAQSYTVSSTGLSEDIRITAPAGFLLSLDDYEYVHELVLTQSGGEVSPTTIFAALYSETSGSFSGNIVHSSAGVTPVNVAVSGEVSSTIDTSFQQGVDGVCRYCRHLYYGRSTRYGIW